MSQPGRAFTRAELLDRVQGMAYEGYERTIDVHIRNLRTKIEPDRRHSVLCGNCLWHRLSLYDELSSPGFWRLLILHRFLS